MNAQHPERSMPRLSVDIDAIEIRLRDLEYASKCGRCETAVSRAATDIAQLIAQTRELRAKLTTERLRSANLEAAIRAALGAHEDGETDPLAYLRDELPDGTGAAYGP